MANELGEFTAQVKGKFYWDLYIDIDNTKNSGSITREVEKETVVALSYNNVVKSVNSSTEGMELGLDVGGMFEVLKVDVKGSLSTKVTSDYENITDTKLEKKLTTKKKDIPIEIKGRLVPVLKDIEVVYTSESITRPDDVIQVVRWYEPDINYEWNEACLNWKKRTVGDGSSNYSYVWLRPIWTFDSNEGVTGIQVAIQPKPNEGYKDLAKGSKGDYRYLKMIRDVNSRERITEIALWRPPPNSEEELPTTGTEDYKFNANLNAGREKQLVMHSDEDGNIVGGSDVRFRNLYLVWNTRELQ